MCGGLWQVQSVIGELWKLWNKCRWDSHVNKNDYDKILFHYY